MHFGEVQLHLNSVLTSYDDTLTSESSYAVSSGRKATPSRVDDRHQMITDGQRKKAARISASCQKPGNDLLSRCFALSSAA